MMTMTMMMMVMMMMMMVLQVSAAFLLFPQEIEIDVNSRRRRQSDSLLCSSSSSLCQALEPLLLSLDCVEAASCELVRLSEFPTLGPLFRPLVSTAFQHRSELQPQVPLRIYESVLSIQSRKDSLRYLLLVFTA